MDFGSLPPEINSGRMYSGPGSAPLLAAATAWDGLADELYSTAACCGWVISGLTSDEWLGPSSVSMAAATAPYVAWMTNTAVHAQQAATQARAAATAYEAAFVTTVPPQVVAANRDLLHMLARTNVFGYEVHAISDVEAHYDRMWARDAAAMYDYASSSAAATTLTSFSSPQRSDNMAWLVAQATAVRSPAAATATALSHMTSVVPQALHGLAQPWQSMPPLGEMPVGRELDTGIVTLEPADLTGLNAEQVPAVSADVCRAARIGRLSVPGRWLTKALSKGPRSIALQGSSLRIVADAWADTPEMPWEIAVPDEPPLPPLWRAPRITGVAISRA